MFFDPLHGPWILKKGVFISGKLHGLIKSREEVELQWVFYPTSVQLDVNVVDNVVNKVKISMLFFLKGCIFVPKSLHVFG